MKKSNITKIMALRKALSRYAYRHDAMVEVIKDYLKDEVTFIIDDIVNNRNHATKLITIHEASGGLPTNRGRTLCR